MIVMTHHFTFRAGLFAVLLLLAAGGGAAADPPAVRKPELAPTAAADAPEGGKAGVEAELEDIKDQLKMLQGTLDVMVNQIMKDLREENELLRQEVRRLHALRGQGAEEETAVPRPGGGLIDEVLSEGAPGGAPAPPPDFSFAVVREWGREPEEGGPPSLKGMVGLVPEGSARGDIENLGRELRRRYDAYDNINIEVYDTPAAARQFADNKKGDAEHRVLSVSRHKASGRDTILYLEKGKATEVPPDAGNAPTGESAGESGGDTPENGNDTPPQE